MPAQVSHNRREGRSSLDSVSENDDPFHPPTPFLWERGNKVSEVNWLLRQNVAKQKHGAQLAPGQDQRLAGCFMSLSAVKCLIQPENFNKVWRRQPSWCVSIVKPAQRKRKETFHVLTSFCFLLLFCFCLCLFYFSVLQDPLLSNLWTPYEHVPLRATMKWR